MKTSHIRKHVAGVLFFVSIALLFNRNELSPGLPGGTNALSYYLEIVYSGLFGHPEWFSWFSWGQPSPFYSSPLIYVIGIIAKAVNPVLVYKVSVVSFVSIAGFSLYLFLRRQTDAWVPSVIGGLLYISSQPYGVALFESHYDSIFGISMLPVVFLTTDVAFSRPKVWLSLTAGLATALMLLSSDLTHSYFLLPFLVAFGVVRLIVAFRKRVFGIFSLVKMLLSYNFALWGCLALFIVPFIAGSRSVYLPTQVLPSATALYRWNFNTIDRAILNFAVENSYVYYSYHLNEYNLTGVYLVLPMITTGLAFSAVLLERGWKTTFFSAFALASIVLSSPYTPFGLIFVWAYTYIPYFAYASPNGDRISIIATLCYAVLTGISLSRIRRVLERVQLLYNSEKTLSVPSAGMRKIPSVWKTFVVISLCVLTISSALASNYVLFASPPTSFSVPSELTEAFSWLSSQSGLYSVMVIPYGGNYWFSPSGRLSQSPSYTSSLYTNRPVFDGEGGTSYTRAFADFVGTAINEERTNTILQVLGGMNVRYLIFDLTNYTQSAWNPSLNLKLTLEQMGLSVVFSRAHVLVTQNQYWQPFARVSRDHLNVIGGFDSLLALANSNETYLTQSTYTFPTIYGSSDIDDTDPVAIIDSSFLDIVQIFFPEFFSYPSVESVPFTTNDSIAWSQDAFSLNYGYSAVPDVETSGNTTFNINLPVDLSGKVSIFAKVLFSDNRGTLVSYIDRTEVGRVTPVSAWNAGYHWVEFGSYNSNGRQVTLSVKNIASGTNASNSLLAVSWIPETVYPSIQQFVQDKMQERGLVFLYHPSYLLPFGNEMTSERVPLTSSGGQVLQAFSPIRTGFANGTIWLPYDGTYNLSARTSLRGITNATIQMSLGNQTIEHTYTFENPTQEILSSLNGTDISLGYSTTASNYPISDNQTFVQSGIDGLGPTIRWGLNDSIEGDHYVFLRLQHFADWNGVGAIGMLVRTNDNSAPVLYGVVRDASGNQRNIEYSPVRATTDGYVEYDGNLSEALYQGPGTLDTTHISSLTIEYLLSSSPVKSMNITALRLIQPSSVNNEVTWTNLGQISASAGQSSVSMTASGGVSFDLLSLSYGKRLPGNASPQDFGIITKQEPDDSQFQVTCTGRCFFTVNQAYASFWRFTIDGKKAMTIPLGPVSTGTIIDGEGVHNVSLIYDDPYLTLGLDIFLWTLVICAFGISISLIPEMIVKRKPEKDVKTMQSPFGRTSQA